MSGAVGTVTLKRCTRCTAEKPLGEFHRDSRRPDGLRGACRACGAAQAKRYYAANRDVILADVKARQALKRPELAEAARRLRARRKANGPTVDRAEKFCRGCRELLPIDAFAVDRCKADGRQSKCRPCGASASKRQKLANPDRTLELRRDWARTNPERNRSHKQRDYELHKDGYLRRSFERRVRKAQAPGASTPAATAARWAMWGGRCWLCREPATATDHVIALARGGSDWPANQRPICTPCNSRKRDRDWRLFVGVAR